MGKQNWGCDVLRNTLFVDWRGHAFICDHDIHGEYGLGDLTAEPLRTILDRRDRLLTDGLSFKICQECNDIMRIGDSSILRSGAGGIFRDWIYDLYKETDDPLANATEPFRWVYKIYEKENRLDRLVDPLLMIERSQQDRIDALERQLAAVRGSTTWKITNALRHARTWFLRIGR